MVQLYAALKLEKIRKRSCNKKAEIMKILKFYLCLNFSPSLSLKNLHAIGQKNFLHVQFLTLFFAVSYILVNK